MYTLIGVASILLVSPSLPSLLISDRLSVTDIYRYSDSLDLLRIEIYIC